MIWIEAIAKILEMWRFNSQWIYIQWIYISFVGEIHVILNFCISTFLFSFSS